MLIADSLALPGFPWSPRSVRYLPSEKVVEALREGQGKIGIIPWQDRLPGVRVLPFSATDDPESNPLRRSLFLSRSPKNVLARLRDRFTQHQDLQGDTAYLREQQVTLLAVGDIMLDRDVKKEGLQKGWTHIFSEVAPRIRQADLSFANLESPIGDKGHFINMFQAPPQAIEGVASAGFDVVSLANNHTLDYHHEGMFETMRLLDQVGIDWVGAGENIQEARRPLITEVSGIRVGFLAYTEMWFVHAREPISWQATLDEPGWHPLSWIWL